MGSLARDAWYSIGVDMKRKTVIHRNPVAKAMLQERQSPKVIPPKKGGKAKLNRKEDERNAIRENES